MRDDDDKHQDGLLGHARDLARRALGRAVDRLLHGGATAAGEAPETPLRPAPPVGPVARADAALPLADELAAVPVPLSPAAAPSSPAAPTPPRDDPPREPFGMLDLEEPPEVYGVDDVTVMARDPSTLFVYWEVTPEGRARARAALGGDGTLTLRIHAASAGARGQVVSEITDHVLDWDHGRRYLPASRPGALISAAVGLLGDGARFAPIAQAPRVRVPSAEPGPDGPVEWMEVAPARSRGARLERPEVRRRGPGVPHRGVGAAGQAEMPRWHEGAWRHPGASAVPLRPEQAGPPSEKEMPSSPWRWHQHR